MVMRRERDIVNEGQTRVECSHIGPGEHIHRLSTIWIHRHVSKQGVIVGVIVQLEIMAPLSALQQAIDTCRLTLARHIHVNHDIRTLGIVHIMGDMIIIGFGLPTME